ncbi:MAG: SGNH/GDSL hydrolase family protein, partial [Planctomycetota bacterium JB042]
MLVGLDLPARDDGPVRFDGLQERSRVVRSDPDLLFRFAPNADFLGYYRTNALGYRGAGAPRPREEVVRRIVTIGDSCTFGLGVPEEAVYSSRLEQTLRRAFEGEGDFEVVSLGIPGYSSWQNRRQIESGLEGLAPDAILWMPTGYNDAVASGGANDLERGAEARSWGGWFARRRLVRLVAGPATVDLERERAGLAVLHEGASPRVPVARFREQLEAGATAARAAGASLLLVRPALDEALLALDPSLARRESEVAEVATALGLPLVDARRAFAPFEGVPVTSDRLHPNGDGHALLAEAAFRTLVR